MSLQIQATDLDVTDVLAYSAINLPEGVNIDPDIGLISGTPTTANTFSPTVTVEYTMETRYKTNMRQSQINLEAATLF